MAKKITYKKNIKSKHYVAHIKLREKLLNLVTGISSVFSFLGGWQVCHNLCLGIVTLLSLIGITFAGMPLFFLTKISVPLWIIAFVLMLITVIFYIKKKCISYKLILFNSGLIIIGIPFQALQDFKLVFWVVGGTIIILSIVLYFKDKIIKN